MAIRPDQAYPAQTIAGDSAYPWGSARNVTLKGDGTGFPLEKLWVNDHLGFFQQLLFYVGTEPNGTPDSLENTQYIDALITLLTHINQLIDPIVFRSLATFEGGGRFVGVGISVEGPNNVFSGTTRFTAPARFTVQPTFDAGINVHSLSAFDGPLFLSGTLTSQGGFTILPGGSNRVAADISFEKTLRLNGGKISNKIVYAPNADTSMLYDGAGFASRVVFQSGVVTAGHFFDVEASPYEGVEIEFINNTSFQQTVRPLTGGLIALVPAATGVPGRVRIMWCDLDNTGARWNVVEKT